MRKIKTDSIWIGIIHMGLGTLLAQVINVLVQPILTRVFSAEELGIYTYLISLATIAIPVASLKLDMLIVSEEDDNEAQYITDTCIIITLLISIIYAFVIMIGYHASDYNIFNKYGVIIYIVPFIVFSNGIRFLFISYLNRYKEYKKISAIAVIRETIRAIIQVGAGFISLGVLGLSLGYAISPIFGLNIQMKEYVNKIKIRSKISLKKINEIIFDKGKRQILFLVPAQFINSFSASIVTVSITALFSAKVLGYYSAGARILDIPIIFITSNVSKVCYQRISENVVNKKPVLKILISVISVLSIVSILGFGILYVIAPKLAEFVFGTEYGSTGIYIRNLCIMYAVRLVATSFNGIYTVFKKQFFELVVNILLITTAILSYTLCYLFKYNEVIYLRSINVGYTVVYLLVLIGYIVVCKKYDNKIKG